MFVGLYFWHFLAISVTIDQTVCHLSDGPLILTKFVKQNRINEAKSASKVKLPNGPQIDGYSGYFNVNEQYNSNLFFWFFPSQKTGTAPVIMYLEGGPGYPSTLAAFEPGPLLFSDNMTVSPRPDTWNSEFSMLYVDNPVGTGFSFTDDDRGFSDDQNSVADNLSEMLTQFYAIFPEYRANELYIAGESYAGKYVPALGYKLMLMANESRINLKGIAIGDGWTDPLNHLTLSRRFKSLGLVDLKQYESMKATEEVIRHEIRARNWSNASDLAFKYFLSINASTITNYTGYNFFYDLSTSQLSLSNDKLSQYLSEADTRKALHVSDHYMGSQFANVTQHLHNDIMKSIERNFTELIPRYKVLLYNGNFDFLVGVDSTAAMLENKNWKYFDDYYDAKRIIYRVSHNDKEVSGYVKSFGDFTHVVIRGGDHGSINQLRITTDMMKRFIYSKPFTNN